VTAEKLYATAMASFRADEHGQAVIEFTELIDKFPKHTLAASAQYWIGEAYYRQRDFNQAVTELQKVPDLYPQSPPVAEALLKLGMCYRALHDLPRARDVGAGGEVAPADRGRHPGARAPRLPQWGTLAAVIEPARFCPNLTVRYTEAHCSTLRS